VFTINNPNITKQLEEKLIYFSPLFAALCFLSTENRSFKIKSLEVIIFHLILDSLIFITSTLLIFFIPILFSLRFSFSLIHTLVNKAPIYLFNNPFLLIFPLLTCLILLFSNFLIGKVIKDLRELFSSISLNLVSFVLYIFFLISLLISISPSIIYFLLVVTDVFRENFIGYYLLIVESYFLFLLIVGVIAFTVKTIVLFFVGNPNFITFFDTFKNSAEKLLTTIEYINTDTKMTNFLASLFYFLTFFSPSLIFLLTEKNEFMKFHSIQAIFLRQHLFKNQHLLNFNQPFSNNKLSILRLITELSIVIFIIIFPYLFCFCIMHIPNVEYWLSKGRKISNEAVFMASFLNFTPSIPFLAIILYLYYSVFSLHKEARKGKYSESPLVNTYVHKFLENPIENTEEKSSSTVSFNELLTSFLILFTKDTNSLIKNHTLRKISLWSIKDYKETILKTIFILWIIPFCIFLYFIFPSSSESEIYLFNLLLCVFTLIPILTAIAIPKIPPKQITSFIDQLSKEDDLLKEENKNGK